MQPAAPPCISVLNVHNGFSEQNTQNHVVSNNWKVAAKLKRRPRVDRSVDNYDCRQNFSDAKIKKPSDLANHSINDENSIQRRIDIIDEEYGCSIREMRFLNKEIKSYKKSGEKRDDWEDLAAERKETRRDLRELRKRKIRLLELIEQIRSTQPLVGKLKSKSSSTSNTKSVTFDKTVKNALEKKMDSLYTRYTECLLLPKNIEKWSFAEFEIFENILKTNRVLIDDDEMEMLNEEVLNMIEDGEKNSNTLNKIISNTLNEIMLKIIYKRKNCRDALDVTESPEMYIE